MCGITGIFSSRIPEENRKKMVTAMNSAIAHRGPDNEGIWTENECTLGHRRLSIIDLSIESNQPFLSSDKRYVIVYNGELYNYKELKLQLQRSAQGEATLPYFFKTNSDTEVVLAAFIKWGPKCLDLFNGMFAFAIYDRENKEVFVARDPMGVKPLYYSYSDEGFAFSSELRAILKSGIRRFTINHSVLPEYAMYQTVMAPNTIIKGIKVLLPGHYMHLSAQGLVSKQYFDITQIAATPEMPYNDICKRVAELLGASVQRRMVSDVPFGAFLSGGIDSSAVVGLMSSVSTERINTFNISFDESEFSEAQYARVIAKKFGTIHHEIKLRPADFLSQLPEALAATDHPGGDGPNTYIVSKATKNAGITMALSGIGGDELFAGYPVFNHMQRLSQKSWLDKTPHFLRLLAGGAIELKGRHVSAMKTAELLKQKDINFLTAYPRVRSLFTEKQLQHIIAGNPYSAYENLLREVPQYENKLITSVSVAEIKSYLQNVLLRDADQMSMAVALEVREPFLDKHLVQFVLSLKDETKMPVSPKKLLVDSLGDLLPKEIVNRPKMGFTLPWQHWLKSELSSFVDHQLSELNSKSLFEKGSVIELWKRFQKDDPLISWSRIWHLATLNHWLDTNNVTQE